ncbi:hypothetical protein M0805_008701 [Coniferiporia weirii]|nr:hypothetical protein M0805_008701 [Coniferiporia weirii]
MFGRLLTPLVTPLVARFDLSPRPNATFESTEDHETAFAENFARDVLIEVMRNSVESLKEAADLKAQIEVMGEIHRIMVEDVCTKDVFRELDGYLLVVNVLAILHEYLEHGNSGVTQTEEGERLAFMLLAESLKGHKTNQHYFEKHVGYEHLNQALTPLTKDSRTVDQVYGFVLSVAQDNFALSSIFTMLREQARSDFSGYRSMLGTIKHPSVYILLITLLSNIPADDDFLFGAVFALTETLISTNHRNKVLLSSTSIFKPIFQHFLRSETPTRLILQKLLKKLLDIGAQIPDVRYLLQRAVRDDGTLDTDILEVIRSGMKAKWPMHFSLEGSAAFELKEENVRGLPTTGFTFMVWMWVERFPSSTAQVIFKIESKSRVLIQLSLRLDGVLELRSSGNDEMAVLEQAKVVRGKWTHLTMVHYPHRATNPSIRVFIDGVLCESRQWAYPRTDSMAQTITYTVGDANCKPSSSMSWCMASSYLIMLPLSDDLPRFVQHLGPRYTANFQAKDLIRFLTYEASTSLNIFLSGLVVQRTNRHSQVSGAAMSGLSPLMRAIRDSMGIAEDAFLFSITPNGYKCEDEREGESDSLSIYVQNGVVSSRSASRSKINIVGDVVPVTQQCLDVALWKIGGASIALRFVELATTPHELSRALGIFTDSARTSWQMSEDMERLRAYEILALILRSKGQLINFTSFETLFEFLGLNFRTADHSVIVNTLAYRTLALDFEIWVSARPEIQQRHLEHFQTLLKTSKYRNFNARQRIAKYGTIRKMLFVLQTDWYPQDMIVQLVSALRCVAQSCFTADDTIKPIVSYLAANLHEDSSKASSPRSVVSQMDRTHIQEKAEQVLGSLVTILSAGNNLAKFSAALPLPRVCLLLLGEHPSSFTAACVLTIIRLALKSSTSFTRKFELVSGWTVLKMTLPTAWSTDVQKIAFDILFGRTGESGESRQIQRTPTVSCSLIAPAIIAALDLGLTTITQDNCAEEALTTEAFVEPLLEELMEWQSSSPTFRQIFKSQQTTSLLVNAYSTFVAFGRSVRINRHNYVRVLEKMNHLILALTLDNAVSSSQKREMLDIFQKAETLLNEDPSDENPTPPKTRPGRSSRILHVAHASVQILGERAYQKTISKIRDWRKNIITSERKRLRRTALDLREYRRHADQSNEWRNALHDDRGLWAFQDAPRSWVLDETEGPCRVRKKLERKFEVSSSTLAWEQTRAVLEPDVDSQSFVQVELVVPPWAEGYEFQSSDGEHWLDEFDDDKLRRVRHELHSGDVIEAVCTVTRIVGVDSSPGLLILGRSHLYMLDGLVENKDGEVIEACDAPKDLFAVPGSVLELDGKQRAQKWSYDQLMTFSRKTCLFRDVALEMYFKDSRSLLIVFPNKKLRQAMSDKMTTSIASRDMSVSRSPLLHRTPLLGKMSARALSNVRDELSTAQRKWQAREISNFTYISILNQTSGRTPGDATQYPIFPWVLADYSSEILDLTSASTFRDLSRPMGALSEARREAAQQRYENLKSVGETPFHYGTHFSSSMIVCHFLIRLEPFTHMFKTLQGGDWDLPDRLFSDLPRAYHSASRDLRGDVRELIPEFFTCPEFLQNSSNLNFGVQQNTGERIHDVKLPPWAKNDPLLFIIEHRKALESDFVSENLPAWIDLIWGCKQCDADSLNVFHPLSYEGSIDLDKITDELEREATVGIIHNFGQTPRKLFDAPHPARLMHGPTMLPLGTQYGVVEDIHQLLQSPRPISEMSEPVAALTVDMISERVVPCPSESLCVPQFPHEQILWGFVDQSMKLLVDRKVVQVAEAISCVCAAFVDHELLVTGSDDSMLRLWQLTRKDGRTSMSQTHILRAHSAAVVCVAACRPWSIIVSGSEDGTAVIWDLNRAIYVRSIDHRAPGESDSENNSVRLVAINESNGYIATCSAKKLCLHTINAYPIVELDLTLSHPADGHITSMAFHEREYTRIGLLATGTSSGSIHLRTWSAADTPTGEKAQWKFVTLRTVRCREGFDGRTSKVTALQFVGESMYHGEESGKVYIWDLPE